jgi:DNA-binding CsgD family transcriptional regulator
MYYGELFLNHRIKYGTVHQAIYAYYHKINTLKKFNKLNQAFRLTLTAYDQYCRKNSDITDCESCWSIFEHLSQFVITIKNYLQGINYFNNCCIPQTGRKHFYWKAKLYVLLNEPDSALIQTLESIRIAQIENITKKLVDAYNQHGLITKNLGRYDDAIVAFSEALKLIDSLALDERKYGYLIGNLGSCYYQKGDFDGSYNYLQIDADKRKERDQDRGFYLNAEIMLAEIELKSKDHKLALYRLDGLMEVHESLLISFQKLSVLELYMQAFKLSGNKSKYEFYFNQWITLTKTETSSSIDVNQNLIEVYSANAIEQTFLQIEIEKKLFNQQTAIKEQESRLQKWLLLRGALFIILVVLFFLSRYRKRALLKESLLNLAKQEKELIQINLKNKELENKSLLSELEYKNKELVNFALYVSEKNDFLEQLKKTITDSSNQINRKQIKNLIDQNLSIEKERGEVKANVENINQGFFLKLEEEFPKLTKNEKRLCALLRLNLSSKEIATVQNIAPASVNINRHRLRKKLNITEAENLSEFLNNIVLKSPF